MTVREVLLLGNPKLNVVCEPVEKSELVGLEPVVEDLHDTLMDCRQRIGAGRAIAAPQIGVMKRLVYMNIGEPIVFLNPQLDNRSPDLIELWDDCLSFPDLLVRVRRHHSCRIRFRDMEWMQQEWKLEDDLSELVQHECDHLDGILAVSRAIDGHSFLLRSQLRLAAPIAPGSR